MSTSESFFESSLLDPDNELNETEAAKLKDLINLEPYSGAEEREDEPESNPDPFIGHGFGDDFN